MLRIAIVEDDAGCAAMLKAQIEQYAHTYNDKIVVYTFRDAVNFCSLSAKNVTRPCSWTSKRP